MQTVPRHNRPSWKSLLPSGLVSLVVHLCILLFAAMSLKGCDSGSPAEAGGQDFREIGLAFVNDSSDAVAQTPAHNPQDSDIEQPADPSPQPAPPTQRPPIPTEVPNIADLLNPNPENSDSVTNDQPAVDLSNTIGPGRPISSIPEAGGSLADLMRPSGTSGMGSAGSLTPGPGETSFMDIVGTGQSFVYVIDTSSSMIHDGRLERAKGQLKASLRLLKPNQRFQVLFYNLSVTGINLRRRKQEAMYSATAVHVNLAEDAITMQTARSGTKHLPAIERALMLQPDVIYFLTDGATPGLSNADLKLVRRRNRSNAEINVIEFASGPRESRQDSWLQLLAADTGGQYKRVRVK